ncbi:MAG: ribonuclease HII [Alphaproteobacteria bacterium]|nr:ribonuclease HII [Alphaproteobacteria bacterium]
MPDFSYEQECGGGSVFGLDEAGRGPWCGPVVAACVCWPGLEISENLAHTINDSKKLSAKKREALFPLIMQSNAIVGIGQASALEIDEMNILQASFLAMKRALDEVRAKGITPDFVLIDGNKLPRWDMPMRAVIGGDGRSLSIAAASIVAKVTRDHIMEKLAEQYPQYGWDKNAGYGTKTHIEALQKYGVTPCHRKTYAPIARLLNGK